MMAVAMMTLRKSPTHSSSCCRDLPLSMMRFATSSHCSR
jgi:hypothetical protein